MLLADFLHAQDCGGESSGLISQLSREMMVTRKARAPFIRCNIIFDDERGALFYSFISANGSVGFTWSNNNYNDQQQQLRLNKS